MQAHAVRLDDAWVRPTRLTVSGSSGIRRQTDAGKETSHSTTGFRVRSHQRENWQHDSVSLCFSTSRQLTLEHCKNIYFMTRLHDLLFVQCDVILLFLLNIQIHVFSSVHFFLHMNELVNVQVTPQKKKEKKKRTGTLTEENINICTDFLSCHAHDWMFLFKMHQWRRDQGWTLTSWGGKK